MAYGDFKDLTRRTARGLASMVYNFFDKKTCGGAIKNEIISNKELAGKLHKPIIRKFNKRSFIFYRQYL